MIGRPQLELDLPGPKRTPPDFVAEARKELNAALEQARASAESIDAGLEPAPPWDKRQQDYWRIVFHQMSGWLPAKERSELMAEFYFYLEMFEQLFFAGADA